MERTHESGGSQTGPPDTLGQLTRLIGARCDRFRQSRDPADHALLESSARALLSHLDVLAHLLAAGLPPDHDWQDLEADPPLRARGHPRDSRAGGRRDGDRPRDIGLVRDRPQAHAFPPFRDQVTGLHSREGFEAGAFGELKRCRRYGRDFAVALLQLPASPEMDLRRAATLVRDSLRGSDLTGRAGPRLLAVALPETAIGPSRRVARRLVSGLEQTDQWSSEARVGLAAYPVDGETLVTLLETARGQLTQPSRIVLYPTERPSDGG